MPAVELDLVALELVAVLHLREIEDAREVEGVVHVEVDVEQRLAEVHRVERVVEVVVFLVLDVGRGFLPQRGHVVDDPRLLHFLGLGLAVLVGLALDFLFHLARAKLDRDGQELAVFVEQFADAAFFEELGGIVTDVKDDVGAAVLFGISFIVYSGLPSHSQMTPFLPSSWHDFEISATFEETMKAE